MPERACWTCKYFDVEVGHYPCCECLVFRDGDIALPLPRWEPNETERLRARVAELEVENQSLRDEVKRLSPPRNNEQESSPAGGNERSADEL